MWGRAPLLQLPWTPRGTRSTGETPLGQGSYHWPAHLCSLGRTYSGSTAGHLCPSTLPTTPVAASRPRSDWEAFPCGVLTGGLGASVRLRRPFQFLLSAWGAASPRCLVERSHLGSLGHPGNRFNQITHWAKAAHFVHASAIFCSLATPP
ncbi:hypothetical protein NDU88_003101 [Pleurodeles waltl]|uniref:Uncharacterized protein n=1 Tax=Pleurodeles waltl TaxID=8319 RepID=A0AAV7TPJ7_PLEWA|nr:hypothetical protein NDU88_003101 [Pleurodeles waltl]